jgi:hypothetical protein
MYKLCRYFWIAIVWLAGCRSGQTFFQPTSVATSPLEQSSLSFECSEPAIPLNIPYALVHGESQHINKRANLSSNKALRLSASSIARVPRSVHKSRNAARYRKQKSIEALAVDGPDELGRAMTHMFIAVAIAILSVLLLIVAAFTGALPLLVLGVLAIVIGVCVFFTR